MALTGFFIFINACIAVEVIATSGYFAVSGTGTSVGLPPPVPHVEPFLFSSPNTTITLGSWKGDLAVGSLHWPGLSSEAASSATFYVLPSIVAPDEVRSILNIVSNQGLEFDTDPDSVDGMSTHELYLEASGGVDSLTHIRGKPDGDRSVFESRSLARTALAAITSPIISERVLPFVNSRYASACGASGCSVCQSLVRRYIHGQRSGHGTHFDVQVCIEWKVVLSYAESPNLTFTTIVDQCLFPIIGSGNRSGVAVIVRIGF